MTIDPAVILAFIGTLSAAAGAAFRMLYLDMRRERERLLAIVEGMVPTLKQLADAQEQANRDAAERHRKGDS